MAQKHLKNTYRNLSGHEELRPLWTHSYVKMHQTKAALLQPAERVTTLLTTFDPLGKAKNSISFGYYIHEVIAYVIGSTHSISYERFRGSSQWGNVSVYLCFVILASNHFWITFCFNVKSMVLIFTNNFIIIIVGEI